MNYESNYFNYANYVKTLNRQKEDGIYEEHHLLPVALGGKDDKDNLVLLTYREHYLAHYLLMKFTVGKQKSQMGYAFRKMCRSNPKTNIQRPPEKWNSKVFERFRKAFIEALHASNFYFEKHSKIMKSDEIRKKVSEGLKKLYKNGKRSQKGKNNPMFNHQYTKETLQKMSESKKGNKNNQFGKFWWTNGILNIISKECPKGFWRGRKIRKVQV